MSDFDYVDWPPKPIKTERLVLRVSEPRDRAHFVNLFASEQVGTYIGGARRRDELERELPERPGQRRGLFVVGLSDEMIGIVTLDQSDTTRSVHLQPDTEVIELGYMFLPQAWGHGYATEACAVALGWVAEACPAAQIVLRTQTANKRAMRVAAKLGFTERERYSEFGAEQSLAVWSP